MKNDSPEVLETDASSGKKTPTPLQMKAEECRSVGIVHFKGDISVLPSGFGAMTHVEFTLDPNWEPPAPPPEEVKDVDNTPETGQGVKRGKDGLTPQEQLDNYGVVLDAQE